MKSKILIISALFLLTLPLFTYAQVPFGGRIITTFPCTCSGGWYMLIYDYNTMVTVPLVFQFGVSRLNSNYNIFTSKTSVLGSYTPSGICLVYAVVGCSTIPTQGMISPYPLPGIGTSSF